MKLVIATMGLLVLRVLQQVVELALGLGVCDLLRSHPGQVGAGELLRAGCLARPAVCSALEPATALRGEVGLVLDEALDRLGDLVLRSEEHTSEYSHVANSYAVFCLNKKK